MFDMIDLAFNNLQQQNKDLRRTVHEKYNRLEVDENNIELNSKVQTSIADLKEDFVEKVNTIENKLVDNLFENKNEFIINNSLQVL